MHTRSMAYERSLTSITTLLIGDSTVQFVCTSVVSPVQIETLNHTSPNKEHSHCCWVRLSTVSQILVKTEEDDANHSCGSEI